MYTYINLYFEPSSKSTFKKKKKSNQILQRSIKNQVVIESKHTRNNLFSSSLSNPMTKNIVTVFQMFILSL